MRWWRRKSRTPMPEKFDRLTVYNAEEWRGVFHSAEYQAQMAELQREYDEWTASLEAEQDARRNDRRSPPA